MALYSPSYIKVFGNIDRPQKISQDYYGADNLISANVTDIMVSDSFWMIFSLGNIVVGSSVALFAIVGKIMMKMEREYEVYAGRIRECYKRIDTANEGRITLCNDRIRYYRLDVFSIDTENAKGAKKIYNGVIVDNLTIINRKKWRQNITGYRKAREYIREALKWRQPYWEIEAFYIYFFNIMKTFIRYPLLQKLESFAIASLVIGIVVQVSAFNWF
jgi:hypothetical protein